MTAPARAFPREAGRGPAVVCVHASASSSAQWRPLMDRLADRYRILAVDLYGSGQSPSWPAVRPLSLADEVALLGPVFATAGERCHLVGHSYGGAVALEAALAAPERVASLVLFEPVLFSVLLAEDPTQPAAREIAAVRDDRAMEGAGPLTAAELGRRTGLRERYVREWLSAQAAGGYVTCDPATGAFTLPPEQAFLLLDADLPGAFQLSVGSVRDEPKITEAFRSGAGVGWHEHDSGVYEGCERFFRPGYAMNLVSQWIPALDGVKARLEVGGRVADVGCGHGASAIIMAQAFPRATITGFDYHPASIEAARGAADKAGVGGRVSFEVAAAKAYPGTGYDLVTFFDCLHDMGDPVGAARHVRRSLAPGGVWMLVEPFANDRLEDNLNPVGRLYYAASTLLCTPASLSQEVGLALGAQAGEKRLREVLTEAGFSRVRRVAQTPANMILEVRA